MFRTLHIILTSLLATHIALGAVPSPQEQFSAARTAFEKNDFRSVQQISESLIDSGHLSPQLFQLLGHVRYREGDLGRAALWYHRASLFPPPAPEIRQNLAHIHERTGNLSFPSNGFHNQFASRFTRTEWFVMTVICEWTVVFALFIAFLFCRRGWLRASLCTLATLAVIIGTSAFLGWHWHPSYEKVRDLAIVTATKVTAHTAASTTSGSVIELPPGSEVRKLEDRGAWCYVEIPTDGEYRRGWVQNEALSPFWPADKKFDPGYLE